jgi:GxxExxY protein
LERFAREKQYADLLEKKLREAGIVYIREAKIGDPGNIVDFLIEEIVVVELKAKQIIDKKDYYQVQRYLKAANLKLGLLINFRNRYIKPKRVLNSSCTSIHC